MHYFEEGEPRLGGLRSIEHVDAICALFADDLYL
jgi:hypothetical protein